MSLIIKYFLAFLLVLCANLLFIQKFSYAQTLSPQLTSTKIPFIDPQIAQEANKHTSYTQLCPKTNKPSVARCFGEVITDETAMPFTSSKPAGFGPAEFRKAYDVTGKQKRHQLWR